MSAAKEREAERTAAHGRLMAAIATELDHGGSVPCLDPARAYLWTSEGADDLEAAAHSCAGCEALEACRRYIVGNSEAAGVWAGLTPNQQAKLHRKEKKK